VKVRSSTRIVTGVTAAAARAYAERVGGEQGGDRSGAIDLAAKRGLRRFEAGRAKAKRTGDRWTIDVASRGRHPAIEGVALGAHRERDVRLTPHRVDPRAESIEGAAGLSVRNGCIHRGIDVWRDTECGVGRRPCPRAIGEDDGGRGPRRGELRRETFTDRPCFERTYVDAADGHARERALRVRRVRRVRASDRKRDRRPNVHLPLAGKSTRGEQERRRRQRQAELFC